MCVPFRHKYYTRTPPFTAIFGKVRRPHAWHVTEEKENSDDEEAEAGEAEDVGEGGEEQVDEVEWSVLDGFTVGAEPAKLDETLIGESVYMRWEKYGWQFGKIVGVITEATPRLFKKYNFSLVWADKSKGPASLTVQNYAYGPDARLNSWVILKKMED